MTTPSTPNPERRSHRRRTVAGVGAGLVAGAAIGLTMVAPSLTSATDDAAPAAVVAQDTDTDTGAGGEVMRSAPGERLRELLQDLVDDGTIDADQADAVVEHLMENRPERPDGPRGDRGDRGPFGHRGADVVADVIGIDAENLRDELRSGASLADIAEANGVDPQVVVDALVDELGDRLDDAVENGRITDDEAAEKLADATERIEARINGEGPRGAGPQLDRPVPPVDDA